MERERESVTDLTGDDVFSIGRKRETGYSLFTIVEDVALFISPGVQEDTDTP